MRDLELSRDVLPIGRFKGRVSELVKRVRTEQRPLVLTVNGEAAAVLISPEDYDRAVASGRVQRAVAEGLADAEAGRSLTDEALGEWADRRYGKASRRR